MRHKDTIRLYQYWNELRAGRPAPDRSEVSPAALGSLLASVMLLDRNGNDEAIFRIAGSKLCALKCRELRGEALAAMFIPADRRSVSRIVNSVARDHTVAVLETEARSTRGRTVTVEIALLPLEGDKTGILGIASPSSTPVWLGTEAVELDLRGIRFINPETGLLFLQNRPSVSLNDHKNAPGYGKTRSLSVVSGGDRGSAPSFGRSFRVYDGGKK